VMLRALYGPFRVLRLCDYKVPVMDKLVYFTRKTRGDLFRLVSELDQWKIPENLEEALSAITTKKQKDLVNKAVKQGGTVNFASQTESDPESEVESGEEEDEDGAYEAAEEEEANEDPDPEELGPRPADSRFGSLILYLWNKRSLSLIHPYSIAGWILSPCKVIQDDVKNNLAIYHKDKVGALLVKLFVPENLSSEQKQKLKNIMLNTFWDEFDAFSSRSGVYDSEKFIWCSEDIDKNRSHLWHKKYSLTETQWLGKLACRVCSKIAGIGNAERNWGDVKHLKTGQRSHLSSEMISKCATIYGAACAQKANRKVHRDDVFTMWDDVDMEHLGLDKFGMTNQSFRIDPNLVREFHCYAEDWEEECIRNNNIPNMMKLLKKYGGMQFDEEGKHTIDKNKMNFTTKGGDKGFKALGCKPSYNPHAIDDDDFDNFVINSDLHGLIYTYYMENPDPKIKIITKPEHIDPTTKEWNNWVPNPRASAPAPAQSRAPARNNIRNRAPAPAPAPRPRAPAPAHAPRPKRGPPKKR
jgi:hypothetical protein